MIAESFKKWASYVTRWINIKNYVGYGTGTSIIGYTSSTNYYTCPKDGFIQLHCYYTSGNWVQVYVANSDGSNATMFQQTSNGTGHRIISIPVFKSQRVWVAQSGSNNAVTFNPYLTGASDYPTPVIPAAMTDYVVAQGTDSIWTYRKWNSGISECWGVWSGTLSHYASALGGYGYYTSISFPTGLFTEAPIPTYSATIGSAFAVTGTQTSSLSATGSNFYAVSSTSGSQSVKFLIHVIGKWK